MRYYLIGNKESLSIEYAWAEQWLKLNGHSVINPCDIRISEITDSELIQIKVQLLSFSDGVLVLDKSCNSYELEYAKALGKKVKYLSKQWKLKRKESRDLYNGEKAKVLFLDDNVQEGGVISQNKVEEFLAQNHFAGRFDNADMTIISDGIKYNINDLIPKKENNNE